MIPKIIHYCWFGKSIMPNDTIQYIAGWKQLLPSYDFKCWNEENFDLQQAPIYVQEAYKAKKYAFVSDYVRLYALWYDGGIYLDTDVELLRPFDDLLTLPAFICWEQNKSCSVETSIIGSEAKLPWLKDIMVYYDTHHFIIDNQKMDLTPNPIIFTDIFTANGILRNGEKQVYMGMLHIFPSDYFAPLSSTRILHITSNTYCIHHFASSWREFGLREKIKNFICNHVIGRALTDKLIQLKRKSKK